MTDPTLPKGGRMFVRNRGLSVEVVCEDRECLDRFAVAMKGKPDLFVSPVTLTLAPAGTFDDLWGLHKLETWKGMI